MCTQLHRGSVLCSASRVIFQKNTKVAVFISLGYKSLQIN